MRKSTGHWNLGITIAVQEKQTEIHMCASGPEDASASEESHAGLSLWAIHASSQGETAGHVSRQTTAHVPPAAGQGCPPGQPQVRKAFAGIIGDVFCVGQCNFYHSSVPV